MSRKSGNNTGVQDSSLNESDSMKAKSDGDEVISPNAFIKFLQNLIQPHVENVPNDNHFFVIFLELPPRHDRGTFC